MDWSLSLQVFFYLQVLDVLTTWLGFRIGLSEASPFIRMLMDDWQLQPGPGGKGNVLRMRKRLHAAATGDTE